MADLHQPCDKIIDLDKEVALIRDRQAADRAKAIEIQNTIENKIQPAIEANKTALAIIQVKLMLFTSMGGAIGAGVLQLILSVFK